MCRAAPRSCWSSKSKLVKVYESESDDEGGDSVTPMRRVVVVQEYAVDAPLLRELREHERQAAEELGEWREKGEVGERLVREYVGGWGKNDV